MSGVQRVALSLTLALATVAISANLAMAQAANPNPSGGTSLRQAVSEGQPPAGLPSFDLSVPGWSASLFVSRLVLETKVRRVAGVTARAIAPRRTVWRRG